jgi:Lrp/AsnC family transcriptional regulator, leucine-responsive regulatory protein
MRGLTLFERELIELLNENSRKSITELSLRLNVSRLRVSNALAALQDRGVIRKFTLELQSANQCQSANIRGFFVVQLHGPHCKLLYETVKLWPEVVGAWSLSSKEVDIQLQFSVRDQSCLERLRDKISRHNVVRHMYTTIILKDWKKDLLEA